MVKSVKTKHTWWLLFVDLLLGYHSYTQGQNKKSCIIFHFRCATMKVGTRTTRKTAHALRHTSVPAYVRTHVDGRKSLIEVQSTIITIIKHNLAGNKPLLTREACVSSDQSFTTRSGTFCSDPLIRACASMRSSCRRLPSCYRGCCLHNEPITFLFKKNDQRQPIFQKNVLKA